MPTLLKAFTPEASQGTFSFLGLRCLNVSAIPGQWPANYSAILLLVWCYPHVTLTTRPLGVRLLSVRRAFWRWANSETIDKPNPLPVVPWPESPKALSDVIQKCLGESGGRANAHQRLTHLVDWPQYPRGDCRARLTQPRIAWYLPAAHSSSMPVV